MITINLDETINLIRCLEPKLAAVGFHLGLTGSVLYKGFSQKDGDLILYPHKEEDADSLPMAIEVLVKNGFCGWKKHDHKHYADHKLIFSAVYNQNRYDIFILK